MRSFACSKTAMEKIVVMSSKWRRSKSVIVGGSRTATYSMPAHGTGLKRSSKRTTTKSFDESRRERPRHAHVRSFELIMFELQVFYDVERCA